MSKIKNLIKQNGIKIAQNSNNIIFFKIDKKTKIKKNSYMNIYITKLEFPEEYNFIIGNKKVKCNRVNLGPREKYANQKLDNNSCYFLEIVIKKFDTVNHKIVVNKIKYISIVYNLENDMPIEKTILINQKLQKEIPIVDIHDIKNVIISIRSMFVENSEVDINSLIRQNDQKVTKRSFTKWIISICFFSGVCYFIYRMLK